MTSYSLGIIGRPDVIEGDNDKLVPVDHKKGRIPSIVHRAYQPERIQLCAYGLLLREAGFESDHGEIYFTESHQRVRVSFTDELVAETMQAIRNARLTAAQGHAPPPLIDSAKCPRCSLVGICLPDETQFLTRTTRFDTPVRLVTPLRPGRPLYAAEPGTKLGLRSKSLEVRRQGTVVERIRLVDISQVCLFGSVQVTTQLMTELLKSDIPVAWFTTGGWLRGLATGLPNRHVNLRRAQYCAQSHQLDLARSFVFGKIRNSRTLLRRNSRSNVEAQLRQLASMARRSQRASTVQELLGIEGIAAKTYFGAFDSMLQPSEPLAFDFTRRSRRPPRDPVNCLLSFLYALVVKDLLAALIVTGFDPYYGFYHQPRQGRPALALDMAEEFRPLLAESTAINLINNGEINQRHFITNLGSVNLTPRGRNKALQAYERRLAIRVTHPIFGYKIDYRRLMELQSRLLAKAVTGEIDAYTAMVTR